jgi:hypothetical protein
MEVGGVVMRVEIVGSRRRDCEEEVRTLVRSLQCSVQLSSPLILGCEH